ncbi:hypothetical protein [Aridibaculum aurantiacum]|uniref:hypothetical protein n=1 Tax=Aridibaculum aurantiacum TaxID=2810307 RepID=UPI001A970071|nr:hypothetical protein [Aridibaculum aurantiacum]
METTTVKEHDGAINPHTNKKLLGVFAFYAASVFIPAAITLVIMKRRGRNFKKWKWVPMVIYFFPYLMIAFYYVYVIFKDYLLNLKIPRLEAGELTNMRYDKKFPLFLYYDPFGRRHKFSVRKAAHLIHYLKKGDIILRRHENYLDSLLLTQASYFTHAGICSGFNSRGLPIIVHAIGKTGVDHANYYDFMRCDDVAILRLGAEIIKNDPGETKPSMLTVKGVGMQQVKEELMANKGTSVKGVPSSLKLFEQVKGNGKQKATESGKPLLEKMIEDEVPLIEKTTSPRIGERQIKLFKNLQCKTCYDISDCIDVVTDMFKIYYKRPYDYLFNFRDVNTLSCVEFIWYCYKCLYPWHNVMENKAHWFKEYGPLKVEADVVLPDAFINSGAFDLVYTSVTQHGKTLDKEELKEYIPIHLTRFSKFHKDNFLWQTGLCSIALMVYFAINRSNRSKEE